MGTFGGNPDVDHAARKASQDIQKAINPHRAPHRTPNLGPSPEMKEAQRRYEQENPSRIRWLFKLGEWINRHS